MFVSVSFIGVSALKLEERNERKDEEQETLKNYKKRADCIRAS